MILLVYQLSNPPVWDCVGVSTRLQRSVHGVMGLEIQPGKEEEEFISKSSGSFPSGDQPPSPVGLSKVLLQKHSRLLLHEIKADGQSSER